VLVSSHLLSEVQQSVDEVVIIAKGELVHRGDLASLDPAGNLQVVIDSPDRAALARALTDAGLPFTELRGGYLVAGLEMAQVGHVAFAAGVEVSALHRQKTGLEESFLHLVGEGGTL
jgi:ABC-2 type transport system ATP-binding protein